MYKHITAEQYEAISDLPLMSARVLESLLINLYAEPGFSDVDASDLATATGYTVKQVMGTFCQLKVAKLIWTDKVKVNDTPITFVFSDLHTSDEAREEAIQLLSARIKQLTDAIETTVAA